LKGDPALFRVSATLAADDEWSCGMRSAVKARPGIKTAVKVTWPSMLLDEMVPGFVADVLDTVEFDGLGVDEALSRRSAAGKQVHAGLLSYAGIVATQYPYVDSGDLRAFRPYWVARRTEDPVPPEMYAWGRRYQTPDGSRREFRFLRLGSTQGRERDRASIAVAFYTAAFGVAAHWPRRWDEPFEALDDQPPVVEWVTIAEVGLADGERRVLEEGPPGLAEEYFAEHGRRRVASIFAGAGPTPGGVCGDCKVITACPTPIKAPGLLGISGGRGPLRKTSATDLRYHDACPAQLHMDRILHLPRDNEYSLDAQRGNAIHALLGARHGRGDASPCTAEDLAVDPEGWSAGRWQLTGEHAAAGAAMLAHHRGVCPLAGSFPTGWARTEPSLSFWDTAANVIVTASPDLVYEENGSWVWREVKSTERERWYHDEILEEFPQLSLALLILHRGLLGGDTSGSRLELETLRVSGADVEVRDPNDPEHVEVARRVISGLAQPWHVDRLFPAKPGRACQSCAVSRWCPDSVGPGADSV